VPNSRKDVILNYLPRKTKKEEGIWIIVDLHHEHTNMIHLE